MKASSALLLLLAGSLAMVHADPVCQTYKKMMTTSSPHAVMDTIDVPDSFTVASVSVSRINAAHTRVGALQVTLLHDAPPATTDLAATRTAVVLKTARLGATGQNLAGTGFSDAAAGVFPAGPEGEPFTGDFKPSQPLAGFTGQQAQGPWVLRIADVASNDAEQRLVTLTGWTLTLCPTADSEVVLATQGPAAVDSAATEGLPSPPSLPAPAQDVNVTMDGNGLSVGVAGANGTGFRMGLNSSGMNVSSYQGAADSMLNLLFPWRAQVSSMTGYANTASPAVGSPGPMMTGLGAVKEGVQSAMTSQVTDAAGYIGQKSNLLKDYVNKKISDHINAINAANAATQQAITSGGSALKSHIANLGSQATSFKGVLGGVKGAVKQDLQDKVDTLVQLCSTFAGMAGNMIGNMASTAELLKDAKTAKAKALADTYTTTEGLAKAHIDNAIQTKVDALNALLDHIIAGMDNTKAHAMSGPVVDFKLDKDKAALSVLSAALSKVAAGVKAMPTPSQAAQNKINSVASLLGQTKVGQAMVLGPEAAMTKLMGKISQFNQLLGSNMG
eukprot:GHRR01000205.1.p1 GENE.GHRR01000205.1~~GHRR01000205.1.p1  ORF type:complete len:558 (+),score=212.29 GHRR01000205.1:286-1959(+)